MELPDERRSLVTASLKIGLVTAGVQFGGSTTFLLQLASSLRTLGIATEVYSFRKHHPLAPDFAAAGVPVHITDEGQFIFEDRVAALYAKIAEFKPTVVIANLGAESYEMLRYLPPGVTRIGMVHDITTRDGVAHYERFLDGIACVNPHWGKQGIPGNRKLPYEYLAHGIPLPEPGLVRTRNLNEPLKLTFFGCLGPHKGTRYFPEIVKELQRRAIPFRWAMYGDGPDEAYLREQLSAEIKAGTVTLTPQLPRTELFRAVRNHDIFIMASDAEGGPFTLLEAMSLGLVPICNDIPCLAQEVVRPENGFIIARDPAKYADTLAALHQDRPRLERMSAAARQIISERYSLNAMAERYVQFIRKIAPAPPSISWPRSIQPKPIYGSRSLWQLSQTTALARQFRRLVKRIRQ